MFEGFEYFSDVFQRFHLGFASWRLWLLDFYVFFWVAEFDEKFFDAVAVVALEHDLPVFAGSAAGAVGF